MSQMGLTDVSAQQVAVVRRTVAMAELGSFYTEALGAVAAAVESAGGTLAGPAFGWYHGVPAETADVAAGFPVAGVPEGTLGGEVVVLERPAGMAATTVHVGSYDTLTETYRALEAWLRSRELEPADIVWEEYLTGPETQPDPSLWQTHVVWPLQ